MKLITSLGTSRYDEACYTWQGWRHITCFAPAASARFLKVDEVVGFTTDAAQDKHGGAFRAAMPDGVIYRRVPIPDGSTEEQLWQVFDAITNEVRRGEEVAFDVTLGFRIFPFLGLMAAVFLPAALDVRVEAVLYGAFEAKDNSTPPVAPVFDLTPMLGLLNWADAAARFKRSGDGHDLAKLLQDEKKAIAIGGGEQGKAWAGALNNFAGNLESLSGALRLIRPLEAVGSAAGLPPRVEIAREAMAETARLQPFNLLLEDVTGAFLQFTEDPGDSARGHVRVQRDLIGWYIERELWIQAATLSREWLHSWAWVQIMDGDPSVDELRDRETRNQFNKMMGEASDGFVVQKKDPVSLISSWTDLGRVPELEEVLRLWKDLSDLRNDLNHAGMRLNPASSKSIAASMHKYYERLQQLPDV